MLGKTIGGSVDDEPRPEVYKAPLELGSTLLLCTGGLTRHLSDTAIAEILGASRCAEEACWQLVRTAENAGGADNITAVVARFVDVAQAMTSPAMSPRASIRPATVACRVSGTSPPMTTA
ncbi:PP2C family protein-serine/threonine phosphatase [Planctomycetota bacterium]